MNSDHRRQDICTHTMEEVWPNVQYTVRNAETFV